MSKLRVWVIVNRVGGFIQSSGNKVLSYTSELEAMKEVVYLSGQDKTRSLTIKETFIETNWIK